MAKLKPDQINVNDLNDFLGSESDFSFEMKVLCKLREIGFACKHGGTYVDPITNKRREFDIHANCQRNVNYLSIAAECKNIRTNFPLLAYLVKRQNDENVHDIMSFPVEVNGRPFNCPVARKRKNSLFYPLGGPVAKSLDQIGRAQDGRLVGNDSSTFDKLTQAANSAEELAKTSVGRSDEVFNEFIVPVLVIPDERLWGVEFSNSGEQHGEPKMIDECSVYLDQSWNVSRGTFGASITLSHLDVITYSYLSEYVEKIFSECSGVFIDN